MDLEQNVRRAQVYRLLSEAFLYPQSDWLEDFSLATGLALQAGLLTDWQAPPVEWDYSLTELQAAHRQVFGLTGSLCYETEIGLPHEFRQSQEMADIAGFYRAFGFQVGGSVRERPDHLAVELEFMYVLALKAANALNNQQVEQAQICDDAQAKFLEQHLGKWVGLFAEALARLHAGTVAEQNPYLQLARFCANFVAAEVARFGIQPEQNQAPALQPTPFNPDFSCAGCPAMESQG